MESPVVEQLKRISEQLKQAREQGGIALEDVAAKTYIPLRLLRAMDEGKFERLPEPVFVQGFIRRYGDIVGLDGAALAKEFVINPPALKKPAEEFLSQDPEDKSVAPAPRNNRPVPTVKVPELKIEPKVEPKIESKVEAKSEIADVTIEPLVAVKSNSTPSDSISDSIQPPTYRDGDMPAQWQEAGSSREGGSKLFYWLGGGLALAMLGLGAFLVMRPQPPSQTTSSQTTSSQAAPSPQSSQVQPNQGSTPANGQKPPASPSPSASPSPAAQGPVTVSIQAVEESWIEVDLDGKNVIAETLPKGTQKSWSAQKELVLSTGNASGVAYSYNQSAPKLMGTSANPETLKFPPAQ